MEEQPQGRREISNLLLRVCTAAVAAPIVVYLTFIGGNQKLPATLMGNPVAVAKVVKSLLARDTQASLKAVSRIIYPGVDDL